MRRPAPAGRRSGGTSPPRASAPRTRRSPAARGAPADTPRAPRAAGRTAPSADRDRLMPGRHLRVETQSRHLWLERGLRRRISVDEIDLRWHAGVARTPALDEPAEPGEELGLVGVGREPVERPDRGAVANDLAVDPRGLHAGEQVRAERPLALVADEQDRGGRVVQEVFRVPDG